MRMLGSKYTATYDRMLSVVAEKARSREKLVAFWPMRGTLYRGDLLVIGRAVNGWDDGAWRAAEGHSRRGRMATIARTRECSDPRAGGGMAWVCDQADPNASYNTNRSAFWRTSKRISFPATVPEKWSSHLCWTNLYKIAPYEGRNPGSRICSLQFDTCADLLRYEIEAFRPKRVLIMTGRDWFEPFADRLGLRIRWRRGYVEGTARQSNRRWVVTKHPERKREDRIVQGALRALG